MEPIILIGGGGHCISCIDVIEQTGLYQILGILDMPEKIGQKVLNYSVIGSDDDIEKFSKKCPNFLITVGQIQTTAIREKIFNKVKNAGGRLPVVISPLAYVSKYARVSEGSIVMHQVLVNAGASIGVCAILNTKSLIEHEASIGDFCHISTGAIVNGQVSIGNRCFIGSNTVVANNLNIVGETIVAAGFPVHKNIVESGTYIGHPLHKIR